MENLTIGSKLIADERQKQIDKHGFTAEHHVNHPEWYEADQLRKAAITMIFPGLLKKANLTDLPLNWDKEWFDRLIEKTPKERLIIAGALIAAELDRLNELENDLEECIGCSKKFDFETMEQDDAGENYCPECWAHFKPLLKAEYDELKANGEID